MEKQILKYEKFIEREANRKMNESERERLFELHREVLKNLQQERLIHLIVTLFFVVLTIVATAVVVWMVVILGGFTIGKIPFYLLVIILVVLSGFYVKHYYFLENHIQGLYKYLKKLEGYENGE